MAVLAELIKDVAYNARIQEFREYKPMELQDKNGEQPGRLK